MRWRYSIVCDERLKQSRHARPTLQNADVQLEIISVRRRRLHDTTLAADRYDESFALSHAWRLPNVALSAMAARRRQHYRHRRQPPAARLLQCRHIRAAHATFIEEDCGLGAHGSRPIEQKSLRRQ